MSAPGGWHAAAFPHDMPDVPLAISVRAAGVVFEGDRRFDVVVRLPGAQRDDIGTLGSIPVMLPAITALVARFAARGKAKPETFRTEAVSR